MCLWFSRRGVCHSTWDRDGYGVCRENECCCDVDMEEYEAESDGFSSLISSSLVVQYQLLSRSCGPVWEINSVCECCPVCNEQGSMCLRSHVM